MDITLLSVPAISGALFVAVSFCTVGYIGSYLILRSIRTLRVSGGGWCASRLGIGLRAVPAVVLLHIYGPMLRFESALSRRLGNHKPEQLDELVSEVVVEVVPFI